MHGIAEVWLSRGNVGSLSNTNIEHTFWTLDVRGLKLRVWELTGVSETKARPPVVCLHGWLDQGIAFSRMTQGRTFRWLALDQRGFGGSESCGPGGFPHFADYLSDLDALVTELGGRVDLVGHSMGGTVASMYAGACPGRVRKLCVLEGLGALPAAHSASQLERLKNYLAGLRRPMRPVRLRSLEDAVDRLVRRHPGLDPDHAALLATHGVIRDDEGLRWSFDPLHMQRGAYPFLEENYLEILEAIQAPTLVVWATESWYPLEFQQRRAGAISGASVVTVKGTHMLPYDAPELVGDLVDAHLGAP